jgi:hypothetical protein
MKSKMNEIILSDLKPTNLGRKIIHDNELTKLQKESCFNFLSFFFQIFQSIWTIYIAVTVKGLLLFLRLTISILKSTLIINRTNNWKSFKIYVQSMVFKINN